MALVHKGEGTVAFSQRVNLVERSDISIHGEDSICDDNSEATVLSLLQLLLEDLHVQMLVTVSLGLA